MAKMAPSADVVDDDDDYYVTLMQIPPPKTRQWQAVLPGHRCAADL
jgi:hypothetical protein